MNDAPAVDWAVDRAAIDHALAALSDRLSTDIEPAVGEAIRYSLLGGGKRLRGLLFLAAYRTAGGSDDASGIAAAIEVVHAYSLVHDDLPCMDDDDMRRGRATVHRVFGVVSPWRRASRWSRSRRAPGLRRLANLGFRTTSAAQSSRC